MVSPVMFLIKLE